MNRKRIPGRASLSFPAIDGILDMDQLLETNPWNQINDFVHNNFVQNILNEFNDRVMFDPKLAPTDSKSLKKKETATSRGTTRKTLTSRTNEEKPAEWKKDQGASLGDGGRKSKVHKKGIAKESESEKGKKQSKKDNGEKAKVNEPEKETRNVRKCAVNLKNQGDDSKKVVKRNPVVVTSTKGEKKCADASKTRKGERVLAIKSGIKNSTENNSGNPQVKENKNRTVARKSDGGKGERSQTVDGKSEEEKRRNAVTKNKAGRKKPMLETDKIGTASKDVVRKTAIARKLEINQVKTANGSVVHEPAHVASITCNTKSIAASNTVVSMNVSRNSSSKIPIKTSTPKRNNSCLSKSSGKEVATANGNVSATANDVSLECNVSIKKHRTIESCSAKQLNDNCGVSRLHEGSVKCKREDTTVKVKKEKSLENNEASLLCKLTGTLKCNKQKEKMATTEKKKVGKFEKQLIEKAEKRKKRKVERHERKAERAMQKFGHHVMSIVKEMNYLPENEQHLLSYGFSDVSYCSDSSGSCCSSCSSSTYCSACS